ncbi:MAG TPA: aconitate hydratase AcnA, partial [Solirubrobacteraceae bacterium]
QDRVPLDRAKESFGAAVKDFLPAITGEDESIADSFPASDPVSTHVANGALATTVSVALADGRRTELDNGHVVIAAITSCTNTSNPSVMLGAGLLARNAVQRGLRVKPWVKTSLAPGSKVVTEYLDRAGLTKYLDALGFNLVGYGCTTCIGNSGPLPDAISKAVGDHDLAVVSVLSGNRNFEGRINPDVKMNYLASPPLVVAYAIAGTMDVDLHSESLGDDDHGEPVYLRDIWPSTAEIARTIEEAVQSDMFHKSYGEVFDGDERWNGLDVPTGELFAWDERSTYVRRPPFFDHLPAEPGPLEDITDARVLAVLGDSVTTDHISPAGSIKRGGPAALYLNANHVEAADFNSFGARRGNHEVMMRGTFANIRLRNRLAAGTEGGVTLYLAEGTEEEMSIYDAAMRYQDQQIPLIVLAGKEYGSGSSRDWAAKGTRLLGVRAVIAESFERIHRSNLVGV